MNVVWLDFWNQETRLSANNELEAVDPLAKGAGDAHDPVSSWRNQSVSMKVSCLYDAHDQGSLTQNRH